MPFLHGGFGHVLNNSIGMLFLGGAVILRSVRDYIVVFVLAMLIGGFGTWLIGAGWSEREPG